MKKHKGQVPTSFIQKMDGQTIRPIPGLETFRFKLFGPQDFGFLPATVGSSGMD